MGCIKKWDPVVLRWKGIKILGRRRSMSRSTSDDTENTPLLGESPVSRDSEASEIRYRLSAQRRKLGDISYGVVPFLVLHISILPAVLILYTNDRWHLIYFPTLNEFFGGFYYDLNLLSWALLVGRMIWWASIFALRWCLALNASYREQSRTPGAIKSALPAEIAASISPREASHTLSESILRLGDIKYGLRPFLILHVTVFPAFALLEIVAIHELSRSHGNWRQDPPYFLFYCLYYVWFLFFSVSLVLCRVLFWGMVMWLRWCVKGFKAYMEEQSVRRT